MNNDKKNHEIEHSGNREKPDAPSIDKTDERKHVLKDKKTCLTRIVTITVIIFYLAFLFVYSTQPEISACITFIAFFASIGLGPLKFFAEDRIWGVPVAMLVSLGLGFFVGPIYMDIQFRLPYFLQWENIGNSLSVLALFALVWRYLLDLVTADMADDNHDRNGRK